MAKSLIPENSTQAFAHNIRPLQHVNMIFTNVDSLYSSEMIMVKYLKMGLHEEIHVFKDYMIALILLMTVVLVAFILILIKITLLSPLVELTELI